MATIGRRHAIVQANHFEFGGFAAWMTWLVVHIWYLIGFKNRLFVFFQWTWSYVTFRRGARLIVDKEWRILRK
jgi:NADH dehydrogenase